MPIRVATVSILRHLTRPRAVHAARRGFTLPEMLIVVVMISLIALIGLPKFARTNAVRYREVARQRITAALATARQAAIQKGASAEFQLVRNSFIVRSSRGDTIIRPMPLDSLFRVRAIAVSGTPDSLSIVFNSRGMTTSISGDAQIIRLSREGAPLDSVVVTKWGMVQR